MPDKRGDAAYAAWDEAARMEHRDAQNITLRFTLDKMCIRDSSYTPEGKLGGLFFK